MQHVLKTCQLFFALCLSTIKWFQYKLVDVFWNKHSTKICIKFPVHLNYLLVLPWESWSDRLSCQRSTCTFQSIIKTATNTTGSYCRTNRQTSSKTHHPYTTCSKCPPPGHTKISDVDELKQRIENEWTNLKHCSLNVHLAMWCQQLRTCVRAGGRHFEHDVNMMWLMFDDFWHNNCQSCLWLFEVSTLLTYMFVGWYRCKYVSTVLMARYVTSNFPR